MRSTATDATAIGRRALLWGAAAGFGLTLAPGLARARTRLLVSTARLPDGRFGVVALEPDGTPRFATALPGRGHEPVVARSRGEIVVMARRPGRFLAVVGLADGAVRRSLSAPDGRHFYGHAVFDAAGRLLYTTENDYERRERFKAIETQLELADALIRGDAAEVQQLIRSTLTSMGITEEQLSEAQEQLRSQLESIGGDTSALETLFGESGLGDAGLGGSDDEPPEEPPLDDRPIDDRL